MKIKNDGELGYGFGAFDGREHIAGPLVGGGAAQVGVLGAKLLGKTRPAVAKYAGLIGAVVGAGVGGLLMTSKKMRSTGISAIVTAAIIGVPRQIEDLLRASGHLAGDGDMAGYLGVITPEQQMAGYVEGMGESPVQMLGANGMGVTVAEEQMAGPGDIQMLGAGAGFGSNFMNAQ